MNKDKATALIYHDWSSIVRGLPREQAGDLFQGLYARWDGEDDNLPPTLKVVLDYFEAKIDESNAKYTEAVKARAEGRKRQAEEQKALKDTSSDLNTLKDTSSDLKGLKRPDTDTVTVTDTDTVTEIKENVSKDTSKKRAFSLRDVDGIIDEYLIIRDRDDIRKVINEFVAAKKQAKKTISETAVRRNINKALDLANNNPDQVKELFELALERGWQGIYEDSSITAKKKSDEYKGIDWMGLYGKESAQ